MISRKLTVLIAVTLLVFLVIIPNKASARDFVDSLISIAPSITPSQLSLECHKVWSGPNHKNDVKQCLMNMDRVKSQWRTLVFPVMNVVLLGVLLISFPLVFLITVCCHCCCQPGAKTDHEGSRCFNWMWIIYALLWSCAVCFFVIFGAQLLSNSAPKLIDDTLDGPVRYFNETAEHILDFASNWTTGKRERMSYVNVDITPFTDVQDMVKDILNNVKKEILKYIDMVAIISYCVGSVGFALMLLMAMLACCRCCVPCLPMCFSCIYWIFGVVFALLGVIVSILAYVFSATCGEVELQYEREPGIFQWYLVPFCKNQFDFNTINKEVYKAEMMFSESACGQLLEVCDNTDGPDIPKLPQQSPLKAFTASIETNGIQISQTNNAAGGVNGISLPNDAKNADLSKLPKDFDQNNLPSSMNGFKLPKNLKGKIPVNLPPGLDLNSLKDALRRPLKCGKGINSTEQCTDFATMAEVLVNSNIKKITSACPQKDKSCTITECAANCTIPDVKKIAGWILQGALLARNASIALSHARPLLECNFVIDKLIGALITCKDLKTGSLVLGVGFFIGGMMFGLAVYVMLRGSCIWRKSALGV